MAVCGEALDWCFAAINSFGPCDKSRVAALKFQGVIHIVAIVLAVFAVLGLTQSGLNSFPWAQYKVNATAVVEVTNASMLPFLPAQAEFDVHINIWGVCAYLQGTGVTSLPGGTGEECSSWDDHASAFASVDECESASTGLKINVIIAVLGQLLQLVKVRKRATREKDHGVKIFNICTCLLPVLLMSTAALGFRASCIKTGTNIHTAMRAQEAGIGFVCFVASFALNLPAALIQLLIPAVPPPRKITKTTATPIMTTQIMEREGDAQPVEREGVRRTAWQ